jgi:hypothetical protein
LVGLVALVVLLLGTSTSQAEIKTFEAVGVVDYISCNLWPITECTTLPFALGDEFRMVYTFDTTAPDYFPDESYRGLYNEAILSMEVNVGDYCASFSSGVMDTQDNYPGRIDNYSTYAVSQDCVDCDSVAEVPFHHVRYSLVDSTSNIITSDAMLSTPLDLANFSYVGSYIFFHYDATRQFRVHSTRTDLREFKTIPQMLSDLVQKVLQSNVKNGISNSLDSKLDTTLGAMDDSNEQNNIAVINSLEAFINAVLAQNGKHIDVEEADMLIDAANDIIIRVENPCY